MSLRSAILELAMKVPELRSLLLALLVENPGPESPVSATAPVQVVINNAPAAAPVEEEVPSGPAEPLTTDDGSPVPPLAALEEDAVYITDRTQLGFEADLAPELDRMLTLGLSRSDVARWGMIRLRDAFRVKDQLYLVLVQHQSTFENEEQYRMALERAINIWEHSPARTEE